VYVCAQREPKCAHSKSLTIERKD